MGVSGGHDIGTGGVDLRVNREGGAVDRILAFHHLAAVVYENKVGGANLPEVHAKGVDPEMVEAFGIAGGDVSGHAFIESEAREQAEGPGQALLAVPAFLIQRGKAGDFGQAEGVLSGNGHGRLREIRDNYNAAAGHPATHWLRVVADYPFRHATWLFLGLTILALTFHDDGKDRFTRVADIR